MTTTKTPVTHVAGCRCDRTVHRFKCRHCKRTVGWCMGAHDAVERLSGPICDECVHRLSLFEDVLLLELAETLEQMDRVNDPAMRAAAAHYHATVKKVLSGGAVK